MEKVESFDHCCLRKKDGPSRYPCSFQRINYGIVLRPLSSYFLGNTAGTRACLQISPPGQCSSCIQRKRARSCYSMAINSRRGSMMN